jgi:hypothetical protein
VVDRLTADFGIEGVEEAVDGAMTLGRFPLRHELAAAFAVILRAIIAPDKFGPAAVHARW